MGYTPSKGSAALVVVLTAVAIGQLGRGAAADSSSGTAATTATSDAATFVEATIRLAGPPVGTFDSSRQPMLIRRAYTDAGSNAAVCTVRRSAARRRRVRDCLASTAHNAPHDPTAQTRTAEFELANAHPGLRASPRAALCHIGATFALLRVHKYPLDRALASVVPAVAAQDITVEAVHGVFGSRRRRLLQDESEVAPADPQLACA